MSEFCRHPVTKWAAACLCALLSTSSLAAQDRPAVPAGPLTLEQVLQLAESRSETIAVSQATVRRAEGEQIRARSGLWPQLSATASYDRLLASEFDGVFDDVSFGDNGGSDTDGGLEDLPFGRKNTWRATLNISQNLYSGGRNGAQIALARAGRDSAQLGVTTTRAQLLFDVTQAYYDAVLSEQFVTIAEATLEQAGATLKQTQAGFDAGTQPEFEVLRARVSRDSQSPVVIRQRVNRDLALLRLKQILELPADANLQLADRLGDEALPPPPPFAVRVASVESTLRTGAQSGSALQSAPLPDRTAVAEAASTVRLRELSLRVAEVQKRPSVSLTANYGRIAYPSGAVPEFERANSSIGVSVQVPILTGGRIRGDAAVARAELEQSRAQLQQTQELAALDTRSAWAELVAARAAWEATAGTVQQAARAYEIADVRYRSGVSTQLELSDSRLLLQQADANRAQAARDLQVARARVALLPDLPLGNGSATPAPASVPSAPAPQQQPPTGGGQLRNASVQGAQTQAGTQ